MAGHLLAPLNSWRPSLLRPFISCLHNPIRRYNKSRKESDGHRGVGVRAPSTAEVLESIAEEKAEQGIASQTSEKAYDGAEEATLGDSNLESVKNRYKKTRENENYHKTPED